MPTMAELMPLMLLALIALVVPKSAFARREAQYALVAVLAFLVARYLWWRFTVTVWPAEGFNVQSLFVWTLFVVEMLAWLDAAILFAALLRRTDRSPEADRHEARLRATQPEDLPIVDVFVATYNEPLSVLEKTIVGAMSIDWPRDRLRVWVLDDGRRDWLEAYCSGIGAGYLRREGNAHAKAGNINAAIARTQGEFFAIFDADFVPNENFLFRTVGFFEDPKIGIVQIPHNFFNQDPMQASLELRQTLPDDQRFFFDTIMPGRDGWDCSFCCGSNSVTRRTAVEEVGGGLPTGSITEDMLLTLALLRKGYVTRYLCERLAVGLAAESLSAFFVQRARWARGAIQILYLREGPFGPGLTLAQRLMFLPTHWLTQSLSQGAAMTTPAIYLLTGVLPLLNATTPLVLDYQVPAILGTIFAVRMFAPGQYFPLAATAHAVLQAFRLLPTVVVTLVKPKGHAFRVTPKGQDAKGSGVDWPTMVVALVINLATAAGLLINSDLNLRIIADGALVPVVAFWALINMLVLSVVATISVSPSSPRGEERFEVSGSCRLQTESADGIAELVDLSLSGAHLQAGLDVAVGDWMIVNLPDVGPVAGVAQWLKPGADGQSRVGMRLHLPPGPKRNALIRKLFTKGLDNSVHNEDGIEITFGILSRIFLRDPKPAPVKVLEALSPPDWVRTALGQDALSEWAQDAALEKPQAVA